MFGSFFLKYNVSTGIGSPASRRTSDSDRHLVHDPVALAAGRHEIPQGRWRHGKNDHVAPRRIHRHRLLRTDRAVLALFLVVRARP